jgi:hypothetical protein
LSFLVGSGVFQTFLAAITCPGTSLVLGSLQQPGAYVQTSPSGLDHG